jgi:arylesterase/paraoxonase
MGKLFIVITIAIIAFVAKFLYDTNTLVDLSSQYQSKLKGCVHRKDLGHIEQVAILISEGIAFLASGDTLHTMDHGARRYESSVYKVDLKKDGFEPEKVEIVGIESKDLHVFHGMDIYTHTDGSVYLYVVAHSVVRDERNTGEYVIIFQYKDDKLYFLESITHEKWVSVNDVTAVGRRNLYVSIDHKFTRGQRLLQIGEELLQLATGSVEYFDGSSNSSNTVATGIEYSNGITTNIDGSLVFVGSPLSKYLHIFSRDSTSGNLTPHTPLYIDTFADNVHVDEDDVLWVAAYPQVFKFMLDAATNTTLCPTQVLKIKYDRENSVLETVHLSDGSDISGASVAARYKNKVLVSSVIDPNIMYCTL